MSHSSSDTDINEPHTNNKKTFYSEIQRGRYKRKGNESSTSGSDFDIKKGKSVKKSIISKKKRQKQSESSNYDSELEKEIKRMSKIGTARTNQKRVPNKEDYDFF